MPARTDHDRRDAQHAARATIAIALGRYIRRITEQAYAHIEEEATRDSIGDVDWSEVGTSAAHRALAAFGAGAGDRDQDGGRLTPATVAGKVRRRLVHYGRLALPTRASLRWRPW